ncbi:MAG TPA: AAA family ATPase [Pyrinomonadaceae bacterium]|nr:AAA family ATPase [Pyrinomonadaceae bacterium]
MTDGRVLPVWAEDLRRRYLRGEASMFVLHGNVYDVVLCNRKMTALTEFLTDVLLKESKETIAIYNVATGVRFTKRAANVTEVEDLLLSTQKDRVFAALERLLIGYTKTSVIMEYAEAIAPAGDPNFQSESDRSAIVTLHRWSSLPEIERGDNVVLLVSENLTELAPKLISNPKVAVVEVPMPDYETRREAARLADTRLTEKDAERYAGITAGLKSIQIASILTPQPAAEEESADGESLIAALPDRLIAERKREILERECFGLVEFVAPAHGFEVVGGMEEVKKDLLVIADSIREGRTSRVPMGILFTGPMGTGKTFVAEAFAKECGLTTIKLKNFRSKWVGATEGNLEKILNVIRAIGQVVVIIDEGDRAFGNTDGEGDGGTSSRVIARIKEFMSDTSNRGRILFLVMTNRPDKLDVDLKRAGRLDRKIPFLYVQTPEEVELVAKALLRKNKIKTDVDLSSIRESFSSKLVGYSNADIEAVLLLANEDAARESGGDAPVLASHFERAAIDYFPSRDVELLEYMELLAVFESSSRRLLPAKYASLTPEELDTKLRHLRAIVGTRR